MKNNLLNQLEGFLLTPPLWNGQGFAGLTQFQVPPVELTDDFSIVSQIPSITQNFVLGKRMESFLELAVKLSDRYRLIGSNLQIEKEKITLGEIDFLVEDLEQIIVLHIEMVYKFYVYDPSIPNELHRWIGPNRKDSLLQKIDKLKKKQLPLLFKPETEDTLKKMNISSKNIQQEVCFKANLFIPRELKKSSLNYVNKDCIAGIYINIQDFSAEEFSAFQFYSPKKQEWPVDPKYNQTWFTYSEILPVINIFLEQKRSPLLWVRKSSKTFERLFVVWW